jgi:glc operon protein GlcG
MSLKQFAKPFAAAALFAMIAVPALAQQPQLAPPPQVPYGVSINTDTAKKIAAAALAEAHKMNIQQAVAIVDTAGFLIYFEKIQDTQLGSIEVTIQKARSSALYRRSTKVFEDGVAGGGIGLRVLGLTGAVPVEGGLPIIVDGKVVGAIGVSGGSATQDGQVAQAGLAALK